MLKLIGPLASGNSNINVRREIPWSTTLTIPSRLAQRSIILFVGRLSWLIKHVPSSVDRDLTEGDIWSSLPIASADREPSLEWLHFMCLNCIEYKHTRPTLSQLWSFEIHHPTFLNWIKKNRRWNCERGGRVVAGRWDVVHSAPSQEMRAQARAFFIIISYKLWEESRDLTATKGIISIFVTIHFSLSCNSLECIHHHHHAAIDKRKIEKIIREAEWDNNVWLLKLDTYWWLVDSTWYNCQCRRVRHETEIPSFFPLWGTSAITLKNTLAYMLTVDGNVFNLLISKKPKINIVYQLSSSLGPILTGNCLQIFSLIFRCSFIYFTKKMALTAKLSWERAKYFSKYFLFLLVVKKRLYTRTLFLSGKILKSQFFIYITSGIPWDSTYAFSWIIL